MKHRHILSSSAVIVLISSVIPFVYATAQSPESEDWQIPPAQIVSPKFQPAPSTNTPPVVLPAPASTQAPVPLQPRAPYRPSAPLPPEKPALTPAESQALFIKNLSLQIQLDRHHFSPGCLDGRWGSQSRQALSAWQMAHNLPVTGTSDSNTLTSLGGPQNLLVDYAVDPSDHFNLAPIPHTWKKKSEATWLGYETAQEAIAEKFHLAQSALVRLNPNAAWPNPPVGTLLRVPDLHGKRPHYAARLEISLSNKWLHAFASNNTLIAHFPCSIGVDEARRPVGELHILNAAANPVYFFDPAVFPESAEAQALPGKLILPGGPNNPVGVAWIGLNKPGYGIHGTPIPEDIGKTESHGCFRLANWNARKVMSMIVTGIPVRVGP
jgi:hypothetical protein